MISFLREYIRLSHNTILVVGLMLYVPFAHAQLYNSCGDFHEKVCEKSEDKRFKYNGQSRSAALAIGEISEFNIVTYRHQDYRMFQE